MTEPDEVFDGKVRRRPEVEIDETQPSSVFRTTDQHKRIVRPAQPLDPDVVPRDLHQNQAVDTPLLKRGEEPLRRLCVGQQAKV